MGRLIDGVWHTTDEAARVAADGRFHRSESEFRNWITPDGAPGPSGEGGFPAEAGRYHLYVALACPWAHRTLIFRKLKKLEDMISLAVVDPVSREEGWEFSERRPDPIGGHSRLHQVYTAAKPDYTGRVTVPVLWDKKRATIVNNESSEIIRMFNSAFDRVGADASRDFYPPAFRPAIDDINATVYTALNNGVYRAGFAQTQEAYDEAVTAMFRTLDDLDERLATSRYLVGERVSEADWRLFTTLVRFDAIYVGHFKCNLRRIADYPNLSGYLRELYQMPGIAETFDLDETRQHYYRSHTSINPRGIVPIGPEIDLATPHGRERLKAA
jgi:putative glutathione S-transferase